MADLISFEAGGNTPAAAADAKGDKAAVIDSFDPLAGNGDAAATAAAANNGTLGLPANIAAAFAGETTAPAASAGADAKDRSSSGLSPEEELALKKKVQEDAEKLHEKAGGKAIDDPFAGL
eukprot:TRINITY_DN2013_c0_g1_i1.p1 TRINITY_DN2013_c0_g1~~TRINITY_DN2013_c0_g1_i1.p1  ORF type:complete len:121 (-),score=46.19 TRINITY_DN2013_c0_g1_i1:619-981(-)